MPNVTITNLSPEALFINDIYINLPPGESITTYRSSADFMRSTRLQELAADGLVSLNLAYTADEQASGFTIYPGISGTGTQNIVQFGKSLPYPTIAEAIAAAVALAPSSTNRIQLVCFDAGIYTESFTLPQWVSMHAPGIKVEGNIILEDDVTCRICELEAASGILIQKPVGAAGVSFFEADVVRATGAAIGGFSFSLGTGAVFMYKVKTTYVENGFGIGDVSTAGGHMHLMCEDIYIEGTGTGVARFGAATTEGYVGHILEVGAGIGNGTAVSCADGTIDLVSHRINANTATNILAPGTVNLTCPNLTGITAGPGTLRQAQYV